MPGWHEETEQLQADGKVQTVGLVQEQHPDRTRLFMQWKQMDWPVMIDPLNLLGVDVVPVTLLIDEDGIIRSVRPDREDLEAFLDERLPPVEDRSEALSRVPVYRSSSLALADALFLWGEQLADLKRTIDLYAGQSGEFSETGSLDFRLGVAYRRLFEEGDDNPAHFERAVTHWRRALEQNPNQYIWRRRIQQYGPRLDKPYSFYDWIRQAREEIQQRGEEPSPLRVEPSGAEFADPMEDFQLSGETGTNPDPESRIFSDREGLIEARPIVVPDTSEGSRTVRLHLLFEPNEEKKAHWNNEAGAMEVWADPPDGWQIDRNLVRMEGPEEAVSHEIRSVEFEIQAPVGLDGGRQGNAYALYYVCEDVDGTCLYRRQDIPFTISLDQESDR